MHLVLGGTRLKMGTDGSRRRGFWPPGSCMETTGAKAAGPPVDAGREARRERRCVLNDIRSNSGMNLLRAAVTLNLENKRQAKPRRASKTVRP